MLSRRAFLPLLGAGLAAACGGGAKPEPPTPEPTPAPADSPLARGLRFLASQQAPDGSFPSATYGLLGSGHSLTPLVLLSFLDAAPHEPTAQAAVVERGLTFLDGAAANHPEGALGFSGPAADYPVYASAMAVLAAARSRGPRTLGGLERTLEWLRGQQLSSARGWSEHVALGGWPMGSRVAPSPPRAGHVDLSMTRRTLQAFAASGNPLDDASRTEALAFVERAQVDSGGFVYSPVTPQLNKAGEWTGYGTATCDGILALSALGVVDSDPRITRALTFLRSIHRLDRNPGLDGAPMEAFAPAMKGYYRAASAAVFSTHGWPEGGAEAMVQAVLTDQEPDRAWRSTETLQKEDDPIVSTAFALQALAASLPEIP